MFMAMGMLTSQTQGRRHDKEVDSVCTLVSAEGADLPELQVWPCASCWRAARCATVLKPHFSCSTVTESKLHQVPAQQYRG